MRLRSVKAGIIKDSARKPAIEITINRKYSASAPSGTSVGAHEAQAFPKRGIKFAASFINSFKDFKDIKIEEFKDLEQIEKILPVIKANTMIALEFAILKALSNNRVWEFLNPQADEMPRILSNVIGGGAHFKGSSTDIQEFLLIPNTKRFSDAAIANIWCHKILGRKLNATKKTLEGAWVANLSAVEVLDILKELRDSAYNELGVRIDLGLDVAASSLWKSGYYTYNNLSKARIKAKLSKEEQIDFIKKLIKKYKLKYVEDPLQENDFDGFKELGDKAMICGDDLVCTNLERLKKALGCINTVIVKPNQIGSLLKVKEFIDFAKKNDIATVMSHRSRETMDNTISHLAVAWEVPYFKCSVFGKERQTKIQELIKIEERMR